MSKKKNMLGTSGEEYLGLVIDFVNKLKKGTIAPVKAKRFLRGEIIDFPVWKKIFIDRGHKGGTSFVPEMEAAKITISENVIKTLEKLQYSILEGDSIDLVRVTLADLGLKNSATWEEICKRADDLGLSLCLWEVAPCLRLQHIKPDVPGERLIVATVPIVDEDGNNLWFEIIDWFGKEPCFYQTTNIIIEKASQEFNDNTFLIFQKKGKKK